MTAAVIFTCIN